MTLDVDCFEALAAFDEDHKPDVLAEIVRLFTDDARVWLGQAERAAADRELGVLRRVGHSLRSACATIGAKRMRMLASELEAAANDARATDAAAIVQALVDESGAVLGRLHCYLRS